MIRLLRTHPLPVLLIAAAIIAGILSFVPREISAQNVAYDFVAARWYSGGTQTLVFDTDTIEAGCAPNAIGVGNCQEIYMQHCVDACADGNYKGCNFKDRQQAGNIEAGGGTPGWTGFFECTGIMGNPTGPDYKASQYGYCPINSSTPGGICSSTVYWAISPGAPTINLTATPSTIENGSSTLLKWTSANANSCTSSDFTTGNATSNTTGRSVTPTATKTYSITCTGPAGTSTDTVTVTVTNTPRAYVRASDTNGNANSNGSATIPYNEVGQLHYRCVYDQGIGAATGRIVPAVGPQQDMNTVPLGNSGVEQSISAGRLTSTTRFDFTCTDANGDDSTAVVRIFVQPPPTPLAVASCSVNPSTAPTNQSVTWTATQPTGGNGSYTYSWSGSNSLSGSTRSVSKSYTAAGVKNGTVQVTSGSETVTKSCSITITDEIRQADLFAGAVTPTTATVNQSQVFSAVVTNQGTAGTGGSFTNQLQMSTSESGTNPQAIGTESMGSLAQGGATNSADVSYTFASAGTYYLSFCADSALQIPEPNEQNCGPWTRVVVTDALAPDITVTVPNLRLEEGESTNLTMTVKNEGSIAAEQRFDNYFWVDTDSTHSANVNTWGDQIPDAPNAILSPTRIPAGSEVTRSEVWEAPSVDVATTYYYRACSDWADEIDESDEENNCSEWATIRITPDPNENPTISCAVTPANPQADQQVTYRVTPTFGAEGPYVWSTTYDASHCTVSDVLTKRCTFPAPGPYTMTVKARNTARINCPSVLGGCVSDPQVRIAATPSRVRLNASGVSDPINLSWGVDGTVESSCSVTGSGVNITPTVSSCVIGDGTVDTTITTQSTYCISCDGGNNASERQCVTVNVIPAWEEF